MVIIASSSEVLPATDSSVPDYLKILWTPEVPSRSPLALGPPTFGSHSVLPNAISGLNYDCTASLRRVDLK